MLASTIQSALLKYKDRVEAALKRHMPSLGREPADGGTILREACEYALLNGGKRFRPALVFLIAEALNQHTDVTAAALAIEYFHTASLIADDLPCMDNDALRRNKPTVHKVYGEATALLATYALIAAGYGLIAEASKSAKGDRERICLEAVANASRNTGVFGATGGQLLDIDPPDLELATLRDILHKKTVSLFEISFVFGWLFGGGDPASLKMVKQCASHFGMAFQIADDIGDQEQDAKNGRKINVATVFGLEEAKRMLADEVAGYKRLIEELSIATPELAGLADALLEKE